MDEGFGQYRDGPVDFGRPVSPPTLARARRATARVARSRRAAAAIMRAAGPVTCVAEGVIFRLLLRGGGGVTPDVGGGPSYSQATRRTMHRTHTIAVPVSRTDAGSPRRHAPLRYHANSFRTVRTPDTQRTTSEARTLVARDGAVPVRVTTPFSARTAP